MLSESWKKAVLAESLPPLVPPAEDRAAWDGIASADREELLNRAAEYALQPWPMRLATDFMAFTRNGSRKADENPYFFRRRKLCLSALACCLGRTEMLDDVIDGIWCICEESSWVISAHRINPIPGAPSQKEHPLPDPEDSYIDLFAAQTGMILTLVKGMLEGLLRLSAPGLIERLNRETDRRLLSPFMENDDCWWMGFRRRDLNNWTPWIVSNIMICALGSGMSRPALSALLERGCGMLDRWLAVVPEDGGCDEGAGYWNMAGGALLDCLQLLEDATGGTMALWEEEKIRNILSFPLKAEIGNGYFLNFADCDARPVLSGERIQTAGEKTGNAALARLGLRHRGSLLAELDDVPHLSRLLRKLFHPAEPVPDPAVPCRGSSPAAAGWDGWLPDLQVRMVRRGGWTLGCKGGHNGENHNHNDVGSFLLFLDGEPEIVDAGNMVYTAKTFSGERYTLWNTRSAYHNVPLIGNAEQAPGAEYRAGGVTCLPDGLALELAGAYPAEARLSSCHRTLSLTADGLTVTDRIETAVPCVPSWVFLFRNRPVLSGSRLETERLRLALPAGWNAECQEIPVTDSRMARSWPGSLWRVRIAPPGPSSALQAVWQFRRGEPETRDPDQTSEKGALS